MDDPQVVGVHGIRQRDTNELKLAEDWSQALSRSITMHIGANAAAPGMTTPYYGDVFPRGRLQLGEDEEAPELEAGDEEEFLLQALEAHTPPDRAWQPLAGTLGAVPRTSPRITGALAAIDRRFGPRAGQAVLDRLSEVHGYFSDKHTDKADQVRDRVVQSIKQTGATLIIAHSLGSVVVYDMFRRGQIPSSVHQLITCGSPLAWLPLHRKLRLETPTTLQLPSHVAWLNVLDRYDPVTAGLGLAALAPGVTDEFVDNQDDPHSAELYLEQRPVALAVHAHITRQLPAP
ncbi:hypothetical protein P8A22_37905 (plasmid) [Streptomyces laculatispora]|uniref:V8-like Glu-specific endopeptidase n=1 Tax=Streptomyces laculatispora TaxID=887464 RepID=A0ABY9IF72_9ACTN|nr:hypothetical protein [Streptomyces laculatispora]WLQ45605.1 hypothetical protein P8A22_37905 [Streptomyces laculatispora]